MPYPRPFILQDKNFIIPGSVAYVEYLVPPVVSPPAH